MTGCRQQRFSYLEVIIAVAILSLVIPLTVNTVGSTRQRQIKNQEAWAREHVLTQVLEYHRLYGHRVAPPVWLLPQGFTSFCELVPVADETITGGIKGWRLYRLDVGVRNAGGAMVGQRSVDVLWREEDLF